MTETLDCRATSDARIVRQLMLHAGLDPRRAARELDIDEKTMQGYASGTAVPRRIVFALMQLADMGRTTQRG